VPHLSPTTLTTDEQRLILRATAGNVRDHLIFSMALGTRPARSPVNASPPPSRTTPHDSGPVWLATPPGIQGSSCLRHR
jgi:hypothetical protein